MWGKDHAKGCDAETAADYVECHEIPDEDDDEPEEEDNVAAAKEGTAEHNVPGQESSKKAGGSQGAVSAGPSRKPTSSKKRPRDDEGLSDLVSELKHYVGAYEVVGTHIKAMGDYFQKESETTTMKRTIFEELKKLPGLSREEVMKAGKLLIACEKKLDTFFAMDAEMRKDYVMEELAEANPYRPQFSMNELD